MLSVLISNFPPKACFHVLQRVLETLFETLSQFNHRKGFFLHPLEWGAGWENRAVTGTQANA